MLKTSWLVILKALSRMRTFGEQQSEEAATDHIPAVKDEGSGLPQELFANSN